MMEVKVIYGLKKKQILKVDIKKFKFQIKLLNYLKNIIESIIRVLLILKIWNDSINQINVKNFLTNIKQEKIKN